MAAVVNLAGLFAFAPQILLPWSGARASQVHSDSTNVASFLCRPSKCDCRVDKRRTKKAVADAPERPPSTLLAPLRVIFKAFPDLKPNWEAPSLSGSAKYFTTTTCQLPSSVSSLDLPSFPAQMGLFPEAELPPGLWGPIASINCQENVSMFTANMICHLHSEWCFFVFLLLSGRLWAVRKMISAKFQA